MKIRYAISFLLLFSLLLSACSQGENEKSLKTDELETTNEKEENEREDQVEDQVNETEDQAFEKFSIDPEDAKSWLEVGPGKYGGDEYDKEAVKEEIKNWPNGLSSEEYFSRLIALTANDYREYQEAIDETDVIFSKSTDRPDEALSDVEDVEAPVLNVQILLDASGSMAGTLDGETKMELAKDAINDFVSELPEQAHVSLRVYGHKGSNKKQGKEKSCATTKTVYDFSPYDESQFSEALNQFEPTGYTPIAKAIEDAGKDLLNVSEGKSSKNIVYVVSDGKETCGGDPVKATKKLQKSDIDAAVNIIGFDIEDSEREALEAIAEAGNGQYFHAETGESLRNQLESEKIALINEWYSWQSDNVNNIYSEQSHYVNESYELENEAKQLTRDEESLQIELTRYMEEIREDIDTVEVRTLIRDRTISMRDYINDEFYAIREEARDSGYELREKTRDQGQEARDKLRNKK